MGFAGVFAVGCAAVFAEDFAADFAVGAAVGVAWGCAAISLQIRRVRITSTKNQKKQLKENMNNQIVSDQEAKEIAIRIAQEAYESVAKRPTDQAKFIDAYKRGYVMRFPELKDKIEGAKFTFVDSWLKAKPILDLPENTHPKDGPAKERDACFFIRLVANNMTVTSVTTETAGKELSAILVNLCCTSYFDLPNDDVLVVNNPTTHKLIDNSEGRKVLHCTDGPALAFGDGACAFYLWGIRVTKKMACEPMTAIEIMSIIDVDQRRVVIARLGIASITDGAEVIDSVDNYQLLDITKCINARAKTIVLKMLNPSINQIHVEAVDSKCKTVQEAINWRADMPPGEEWNPLYIDSMLREGGNPNQLQQGDTLNFVIGKINPSKIVETVAMPIDSITRHMLVNCEISDHVAPGFVCSYSTGTSASITHPEHETTPLPDNVEIGVKVVREIDVITGLTRSVVD